MTEVYDLAVIGAGPAGLETALTASERGVKTVVIDHYAQAGGQFYKSLPTAFITTHKSRTEIEGEKLVKRLEGAPVTHLCDTLTWGLFKDEEGQGWVVGLNGPYAAKRVKVHSLVLATGAYDTSVAFPGWLLPGVITCGAALVLLKNQRIAPFRRVLVTGAGPLLLSVAAHLAEAGVEVVSVCETNRIKLKFARHGLTVLREWQRLEEAAKYLFTFSRKKIPYKMGYSILEAHGDERVEKAVIAQVDGNGKPVAGTEQNVQVDAVVCGYGLTPNTGLARMLDCDLDYQPEMGGWIPRRTKTFQTSLPGVYMVGDCAGIRGAKNARLEGRVAGIAVAAETGHIDPKTAEDLYEQLKPKLIQQSRFAETLSDVFSPKPGLISLAHDDTILCRCEEITLSEVKAAVAAGACTLPEVKMITRVGMGNCQGRICENPVSEAIVQQLAGEYSSHQSVGRYSIRPPLQPLPFGVFAEAGTDV